MPRTHHGRRLFRVSLGAALLAPLLASAAHAGLEVCNQTSVQRYVAIGYLDSISKAWTSEGWWTLQPGECAMPVEGDLTQQFYYYRAEDPNEQFNGDGYSFCTINDAFTIVGDENCESRGYRTTDFREIDTGEVETTYTLILNPATVPGARAKR